MDNPPILDIAVDTNQFSIAASCRACGEKMQLGEPRTTSAQEATKWVKANFDIHVAQNHSSLRKHKQEDISQATLRLVREVTERD